MIFFALSFGGLTARAEPLATNLTPDSAVLIAVNENRDLIAARFAVRQAEGRLLQAGLWPNPEFELARQRDTAFGNEGEYNLSAGFKQRFPITGRLQKARNVARVDVAMAAAEIRNQERLLIGEVLGRARELQVLREQLNINSEIQKTLQQLVDVSEKRLKAAETSEADVNLAKLELQKVILSRATLLTEEDTAKVELNRLMGRAPQSPIEIIGTYNIEIDLNALSDAMRRAVPNRPDRQLAALAINHAAAEINLARAQKWEDWTVGFGYSRDNQVFKKPIGNQVDQFLGLSVSIPLPLFNKNQGRIQEAQAAEERAQAELSALELRILAQLQAAKNQMARLLTVLRQYREESITLAEKNVALLQQGYANGLANITAVIQAQQQLTDLRVLLLQATRNLLRIQIEFETGAASSSFLQQPANSEKMNESVPSNSQSRQPRNPSMP